MYITDRIHDNSDARVAIANDASLKFDGFSLRPRFRSLRRQSCLAEKQESTGKWRFLLPDFSAVIWEPKGNKKVRVGLGFPLDDVRADSSVRFQFVNTLNSGSEDDVCDHDCNGNWVDINVSKS